MHDISIEIPGDIDPLERGDRFEDPIVDALDEAGIDVEFIGGGSSLGEADGRMIVTGCDFQFEVSDVKRSIDIIVRILREADAPPDTTISFDHPKETTLRLGDLPQG